MRKRSPKREAILDIISGTDSHPSAEWVYSKLKARFPSISLGTVYRNLALLRESGAIKSVGIVAGEERFDAKTHEHPHFVCERCGAVIDLAETEPPQAAFVPGAFDAGMPGGMRILRRELVYYGHCAECAASQSA
jgi:Fur family peroxide stress response transcriptional regulator